MDYSKVPLPKRTRCQREVFYREFNQEKKKKQKELERESSGRAKEGADSATFEASRTKTVRESETRSKRIDKGLRKSDNVEKLESVVRIGGKVGVDSASFETSKTKQVGRSETGSKKTGKGLRKSENVVRIGGKAGVDSVSFETSGTKQVGKSETGSKSLRKSENVEKLENVVRIGSKVGVDSASFETSKMKQVGRLETGSKKTGKGLRKSENVVRIGGKAGIYSASFETSGTKQVGKSETRLKSLRKSENLEKIENVVRIGGKAGVDLKRGKKSGKKLNGNRNVFGIGDDCEGSDEEIEFLGMRERKGLEDEEVEFLCVVDSNGSCFEEQSGLCKSKDAGRIDGEEGSSCSGKRVNCASVRINGGKSSGVLNGAQSRLGFSKKRKEVIDFDDVNEFHSADSSNLGNSEFSGEEDNGFSSDHDYENPVDSEDSSSSSDYDYDYEDDDDDDGDKEDDKEDEYESCVVSKVSDIRKGEEKIVEVKEEIFEGSLKRERGGRLQKDANLGQSSIEGGVKRRKIGLDFWVDCERDGKQETEGPKSMVERLRLRHAKSMKNKRNELGTISCPFTLTDEELDFSSGGEEETDDDIEGEEETDDDIEGEEETDDDIETGDNNGNDAKAVHKASKKGEIGRRKVGRPAKRRNNCVDSAAPISIDKVDVNLSNEKQNVLGTSSSPCTLTDEEIGSSSGDEETDLDVEACFDNGNNTKNVWKASEEGERGKKNAGRPAKRRRNFVGSAAQISVAKILADSIWEKGDVPLEKLVSFSGDKAPDQEPTLPLKFRFEDEDPKPPEKSFWDIEADKLFAEMDFALAACEIGSPDSSAVENEGSITEDTESDPAACCRQGKHQLVLDEQIGLKCKFCSFVKLEIKHILPSFSKHPWGRSNRRGSDNADHFNFDELSFLDSASIHRSSSKQYILPTGTVWDIIPGIKNTMYPHQREGFEFIWENIAGGIDLEELKKSAFDGGSGCIISHAPGTGKTRLTIVFLQTYMELNPTCMPVIIAPKSMLLTWEEEFRKWKVDIPFHNLNKVELSGRENSVAVSLLGRFGRRRPDKNTLRMVKLYSWKTDKSILGISYSLFEKLAKDGLLGNEGSKMKTKDALDGPGEKVRKMLLELPGLLVLDEGHNPRNDQSLIWQALSRVETQRRIILSGTPFQNNFGELFNTLCLVRPKFSDSFIYQIHGESGRKQGMKSRAARGKWASLTNSIGKDMDDKLAKLRAMIDPFVHVHKGSILKKSLPGMRHSMVCLNPTDLQKALIEIIQVKGNVLELDCPLSLISVHPSLLLRSRLAKDLSFDREKLEMLRLDPKAGVKLKFLMDLIRLSMALNEKVLVFSQYIDSLVFIREHLVSSFDWTEGKELLYMDGKLDIKHRQASISLLNDPASNVQVLLASMRACSEGINLVGASRVVLLDVAWNPAVERQAISRAYRIGQKKIVYIYHLIMSGTREEEKYVRQAEKDRLSELVFSSAEGKVHKPENYCAVSEDKILQEMVQHESISYMFKKILI